MLIVWVFSCHIIVELCCSQCKINLFFLNIYKLDEKKCGVKGSVFPYPLFILPN